MTLFLVTAALLTVLSIGLVAWPLLRARPHRSPLAATLAALMIPILVWFVYPMVSSYDWVSPPVQAGHPQAQQMRTLDEAVNGLERGLAENPSDEEGWVLLGSSYLALQRPGDAVQAYRRAVELSNGKNMAARLGVAEAQIAENPAALSGAAGQEIEAVLAQDPGNPKALWYGGMLALSRGDLVTVRSRWQALLDLDPPAEIQRIIAGQLAQLDTTQPVLQAADNNTPAAEGASIDIQVSVSTSLREQISPSAPLFIFVRDPGKPGPPLAVVRRLASELPLSLRISDADLMLPGGSGLAALKSAALVARVANGGNPVAQAGDLYGQASWSGLGATGETIAIVIDQVVN
jgi:cytochrome c-type biogenesis protein CcmH